MKSLMKRIPLASYFILAFLLMWSLSSIAVFRIINIDNFPLLYILGAWTPTIAAVIVSFFVYGLKTTVNLLKGWLIWKVSLRYYIMAIVPLLCSFLFSLIYSLLILNGSIVINSEISILSLFELLIFSLLLGPTGEEAGWRGFALRFLQKRFNAVIASVILGIIWSVWHLPMWFIPGLPEGQIPFWLFTVDHIAGTIFLTWIFNSTRGSLLLVCLLHLSQNLAFEAISLFKLIPIEIGYIAIVAVDIILAVIILLVWGKKNLSTNNKKEQDIPLC